MRYGRTSVLPARQPEKTVIDVRFMSGRILCKVLLFGSSEWAVQPDAILCKPFLTCL
jgi:hypothetical protein